MDHLRFSGKSDDEQRSALTDIIRASPLLMEVLDGLRELNLPDSWLVSGAIYNTVWNHLTGRPAVTGIKDFDLIYFDDSDLSYEAEDVHVRRCAEKFPDFPLPVELRNQARVHLWFPQKFGQLFAPLNNATQSLQRYASKTHSIAARLDNRDNLVVEAPFGLDHMFSFRVVPNHVLENRYAHEEKGARAKANWPEITVESW